MSTIKYRKWKRKIMDRRYKHIHHYKLTKGCELCGWKPSKEYIDLHKNISVGYAFCFDHLDEMTKSIQHTGGKGGTGAGMKALICKVSSKDKKLNRQHIRNIFNEIRKCRVICHNCHNIISQTQAKKAIEINEKRTGNKWSNKLSYQIVTTKIPISSETSSDLNQFFN